MSAAAQPRVFSGIQPTGIGQIHIGNYLGAVENWVELQAGHDCIYSIVDLHALTSDYDAKSLPMVVLDVARTLLACGLDERATLFVQSEVAEHVELAWILNTVTPMGELSRMTQFKEKSEQQKSNVNAGLFTYPVLQAADILLYKAELVPVGDDQVQHLELTREIARRFNARFGETFPEPQPLLSRTPRILGLDGKAKMSKSLGNHIALLDDEAAIQKKLQPAFTDPQRQRRTDPGRPEVCNIFTLHRAGPSPAETVARIDRECRTAEIGCADCKKILAGNLAAFLAPIRRRAESLAEQAITVRETLERGAQRCRAIAAQTMQEVRRRTGLRGQP